MFTILKRLFDRVRCRYTDCPKQHPVAREDERITCPMCRDDLGLPPLGDE
jgi:hypothetical protein